MAFKDTESYRMFLLEQRLIDKIQFWINTQEDRYIDKHKLYKFVDELRPRLTKYIA